MSRKNFDSIIIIIKTTFCFLLFLVVSSPYLSSCLFTVAVEGEEEVDDTMEELLKKVGFRLEPYFPSSSSAITDSVIGKRHAWMKKRVESYLYLQECLHQLRPRVRFLTTQLANGVDRVLHGGKDESSLQPFAVDFHHVEKRLKELVMKTYLLLCEKETDNEDAGSSHCAHANQAQDCLLEELALLGGSINDHVRQGEGREELKKKRNREFKISKDNKERRKSSFFSWDWFSSWFDFTATPPTQQRKKDQKKDNEKRQAIREWRQQDTGSQAADRQELLSQLENGEEALWDSLLIMNENEDEGWSEEQMNEIFPSNIDLDLPTPVEMSNVYEDFLREEGEEGGKKGGGKDLHAAANRLAFGQSPVPENPLVIVTLKDAMEEVTTTEGGA